MRTGIVLPTTAPGTTGADLAGWAQKAEAAGFDSIAVLDLPGHDGYEPLIALTLAAAVTDRVELIASLVVSPLRSADALAAQADTVDRMNLGRLTLGVSLPKHTGGFEIDHKVRAAALDDHLRRLGAHRVLVSGTAAQAARSLMTGGQGWTTTVEAPELFAAGITVVRDGWASAGRAGEPRGVAVLHVTDLPASEALTSALDDLEDAGATDVLVCPCTADLAQLDLIAGAALRTPAYL
jgi:alkanesulfonate monooxygenase SsuD/methylene tetrahydromethanopterin reductase-like flavin-dependent oxidoreductase (luciferase family)